MASALVQGSSVCDYYGKQCTQQCNKQQVGNTPSFCNTQQGASFGYTLDSPCTLRLYSDTGCNNVVREVGKADRGCVDFPGTGGSWRFFC
ncbi:hypothetical protein PG988_000451 [Apiospora saccharicola]